MRVIVAERGHEYRIAKDRPIRTPSDIALQAAEWGHSDTECFAVLALDAKNGMRACELVTLGLVDATMVHAREVFRVALRHNAAAVVVAHNHPSGDTTPSAQDLRTTKNLIKAGHVLDIKVLDHVIVAPRVGGGLDHLSLRESGLASFE